MVNPALRPPNRVRARSIGYRVSDRITYLGHATVLMELANQRILTDPVLTGRITFIRRHTRCCAEPHGPAGRRPHLPRSPGSPASRLDAPHLPGRADHRAQGTRPADPSMGVRTSRGARGGRDDRRSGKRRSPRFRRTTRAFGRPGARRPSRSASWWPATGAGSTSRATRTSIRACPTSDATGSISRSCRCGAGARGSGPATSIPNAPRTRSACCVRRWRSRSIGERCGRSRCAGAASTSPSRRDGWPPRSPRITRRQRVVILAPGEAYQPAAARRESLTSVGSAARAQNR